MRRRASLLVLVAPAVCFVWAGCALVIDLGDEAKLRPRDGGVDTSVVADTEPPPQDVVQVETAPPSKCLLPRSTDVKCGDCIENGCCTEAIACAQDPDCVKGLDCIKDCMVQPGCINTCPIGNPALAGITFCSQSQCNFCTPSGDCARLGQCGVLFDAAVPAEAFLRNQVASVILNLDQAACRRQHVEMKQYSDASVCYFVEGDAGQ